MKNICNYFYTYDVLVQNFRVCITWSQNRLRCQNSHLVLVVRRITIVRRRRNLFCLLCLFNHSIVRTDLINCICSVSRNQKVIISWKVTTKVNKIEDDILNNIEWNVVVNLNTYLHVKNKVPVVVVMICLRIVDHLWSLDTIKLITIINIRTII